MNTRASHRSNSPLPEPLEKHSLAAIRNMSRKSANDGLHGQAPAGSVAMFTPISPPVLRSIDPVDVAVFLKERERYEIEVESKSTEIPTMKAAPYTASIDRTLLKNLIYMGKLHSISPNATIETISNEQLKEYIYSLVKRCSETFDPSLIEHCLEGLR